MLKIPLALLLLLCSLKSQALSTTTADSIQGRASYLAFDDLVIKVTATDDLLGINLSNSRKFTPQSRLSLSTIQIKLPEVNQSFADINMTTATLFSSLNLKELVAQRNRRAMLMNK